MKKRVVWRPGDTGRIVIPRFVQRVGYPKTVADYHDQLDKMGKVVHQLIPQLIEAVGARVPVRDGKPRQAIERQLAYLMAQSDGFGGPERSIHWTEYPELEGWPFEVCSMRTACTGFYIPAQGCDEDFDPPALTQTKHHRLATIGLRPGTFVKVEGNPGCRAVDTLEVPIEHIEKAEI